ncbi:MAG TPA: ABC transporter ATP-binding protein [Acidimicrobiales bacterium]|nr:ABC transporter ATP-binding protein [Acidimicrobiales bacterium]
MPAPALWRARPYLRPYRWHLVTMAVTSVVAVVTAIAVPSMVRRVVDGPIARGDAAAVLPMAGAVLVLGLFEAFAAFVRRRLQVPTAAGFEQTLRDDLYAHLQRLPPSFHDAWQSGQLLSRAMADLAVMRRFASFGLVMAVVNLTTFAVVIALLARLDAPLALLVATSLVPLGVLTSRFRKRYRAVARQVQDRQGDLTTVVEESAAGIRVVKAFGRSRVVAATFDHGARRLRASSLDAARTQAAYWPLIDLVPNVALAAVLLVGGLAVGHGTLTLGELVAFISLVLMLVWPVESLGRILADGQEASSAARRVFEVLDTPPAIADRPGAVALGAVAGHLRLSGVGFRFPGSDSWALRGVDLEVRPGETLALVGGAGAGKTALLELIPRLHDVTEGAVTLDGHDVRDLTLASLRRHVGVAFDDPLLFSASVRENLLLGSPDAGDDELAQALAIAQAGFVYDLPWGLDTRVGEQGLSLSGGQRQRLALARAVVGRPALLVLDDPLSSLDIHTEALVEEALAAVLAGTTAVVAVHRRSTLALADRIAFLEQGRVLAVGTHAELVGAEPAYRRWLGQPAPPADPAAVGAATR